MSVACSELPSSKKKYPSLSCVLRPYRRQTTCMNAKPTDKLWAQAWRSSRQRQTGCIYHLCISFRYRRGLLEKLFFHVIKLCFNIVMANKRYSLPNRKKCMQDYTRLVIEQRATCIMSFKSHEPRYHGLSMVTGVIPLWPTARCCSSTAIGICVGDNEYPYRSIISKKNHPNQVKDWFQYWRCGNVR